MGLFGIIGNRKKTVHSRKPNRKRRALKAERKKHNPDVQGYIPDPELQTVHQLRKRRTNPKANITLSGKKKTKLLRQLKRMQAEKNQMEVCTEVRRPKTAQPETKGKKKKSKKQSKETPASTSNSEDTVETMEVA